MTILPQVENVILLYIYLFSADYNYEVWYELASTHSTEDRPKLYDLQLLKGQEKRVRIIEKVAPKWKKLGDILKFEDHVLETIDQGSHYKPEAACRQMLQSWLDGKALKPVTWKTLIEALEDVPCDELVQDIRAIIGAKPSAS